ncbi:thiol-activated cytolysin family protein [Rhodohalobacter mucosus]|uniref:Concanavalin A-like lectin/glucanase superfamily protein n=1 Tax=Rhodohalobacter mucosus TaxID=2079485 RepID=A0A316TTE5_9BACT|nr:thiol-activated cytolysin family protein [Rhodohalobacter mucosus]PWN06589.1 hypothetical protein DDZ15_08715 [Rhodohalobacter mucosus]
MKNPFSIIQQGSSLRLLFGLPIILLIFFMSACSENTTSVDPVDPIDPDEPPSLGEIINGAGEFEEVEESYSESETEELPLQTSGDQQYYCTTQTINLTKGYSDFPQFDPNSQVIFPGNLLQGNTLDNATPSSIPVDRGPGTVVITLVNGASSASRQLDVVGLGSVFDAMNEIIADNPGDLPARTTYSMERITSREQLGVSLRAEYSNLTTDVQGSFSYNEDISYNRYLVRLTQSYYTIAFEAPTDPADFFGEDVTAEQLSRYVQPGNPAAYISSVTYGRVFYLLIQSTDSFQEMRASIDASFNGGVSSGSIGGDVKYVSELSSVQIGGYAIGGDADQAAAALTGDLDALKTFIAEGGTITTGQPLSYTVNAANDPARQLKVKVATEYDIVDCAPLSDALFDGVAWYRGSKGVVWDPILGARGITRWQDLFGAQTGDNSRDAVVPFGGPQFAGLWNPGNPDGGYVPSFQFNTTAFTGRMRVPGTPLRNTDYTIAAIVSRTGLPPGDNTPVYWFWGDSSTEGRGIRIGFDDSQTVSITHGGDSKVTANLDTNIFNDQLLIFTFSQTDGMRIYINGLEEAHDPDFTTPIEQFLGSSIGVSDINGFGSGVGFAEIRMLELQIYDYVPSIVQIRALEKGLLEYYFDRS